MNSCAALALLRVGPDRVVGAGAPLVAAVAVLDAETLGDAVDVEEDERVGRLEHPLLLGGVLGAALELLGDDRAEHRHAEVVGLEQRDEADAAAAHEAGVLQRVRRGLVRGRRQAGPQHDEHLAHVGHAAEPRLLERLLVLGPAERRHLLVDVAGHGDAEVRHDLEEVRGAELQGLLVMG